MTQRVRGHANRERSDFTGQFHKFNCVREVTTTQRRVRGDVATEGHDVGHAPVDVVLQNFAHLGSGVTNADEVGHSRDVAIGLN